MMSRRSFVKELQIKVDSNEIDVLKQKLDSIYVDTIKSSIEDFEGSSKEDIERLKSLKMMLDDLSSSPQQSGGNRVKEMIASQLKGAVTDLGHAIQDFFADVFANAKERMIDMASYDLGSSLVTNQRARSQALQFGITDPSQNYALSQSMSELGMQSEEDLMYMNERQQEKFAERMGHWTSKYDELANRDFFNTIQEFSLEFGEFKADMELGLIEFFINNKEQIKLVMTTAMAFMEGVVQLLGGILGFLQVSRSDSQKHAASMELVRNYGTNVSSTNVNISNTLNPSSQVLTDKQMLSQAGTLSYAQLIEALNG